MGSTKGPIVARPLLNVLAGQLGRPHGVLGRLFIGNLLNAHNGGTITAAVTALAPQTGDIAADVGFGGGAGLRPLLNRVGPNGRVEGIDISQAMLHRADARFRHDRDRLRLQTGSLTGLPLGDASIDGMLCINTIYFVADLGKAFDEIARVLAPSGRLVLGMADPDWMAKNPVTAFGEFRIRPLATITDGLAAAGLQVANDIRPGDGGDAFHLLVARQKSS
ncbi:MAG: methyltransferase protein [Amycolatopsis sp.]|uniref:class I SAM-dependent methyltransferase n=1 Tax=Amycolatopsis sp. TaxID=37632 RepID=UPI002635C1A4|nr:methyltransferase domain-containing protein [Amycolatopsis sp.]MCU1679485.1 methyltransferase protein [Amycolatopsis sp.]